MLKEIVQRVGIHFRSEAVAVLHRNRDDTRIRRQRTGSTEFIGMAAEAARSPAHLLLGAVTARSHIDGLYFGFRRRSASETSEPYDNQGGMR